MVSQTGGSSVQGNTLHAIQGGDSNVHGVNGLINCSSCSELFVVPGITLVSLCYGSCARAYTVHTGSSNLLSSQGRHTPTVSLYRISVFSEARFFLCLGGGLNLISAYVSCGSSAVHSFSVIGCCFLDILLWGTAYTASTGGCIT